jgi:hypothetical protein
MGDFYLKTMESYLSTIIRNHAYVVSWRKIEWLNVQNAEQKFQSQRKLGRWLGVQIKQENECNWKSGSLNAQNARLLSAKY